MGVVKLSAQLVNDAKIHAKVKHRSIPKQIEYWAMLGRIAEDNPEMTGEMILQCISGLADAKAGNTSPYIFTPAP